MSFKFRCPHCGQKMEAEEDSAGCRAECPVCEKEFVVPRPAAKEYDRTPKKCTTGFEESGDPGTLSRFGPKRPYVWASPTALVLLLALFLPFISISCNDSKLVRASVYGMMTEDNHIQDIADPKPIAEQTGSEVADDTGPGASWLPGLLMIVIGLCGLAVSGVSLSMLSAPRNVAYKLGLWFSLTGLCATFALGAYCGVYLESFMHRGVMHEAAGAGDSMEQAFAASLMSSMRITVNMESAYYLILAVFIFAIACFVVHKMWRSPARNDQIRDTVVGVGLGVMIAVFVVMTFTTLLKTAQFSSFKDMEISDSTDSPESVELW